MLVRHGASAAAHPGVDFPVIEGGHADPALDPQGEREAEAVAARLAGERFAGLYVTPLRRTRQTAAPLAARLGLEPVVVPELREVFLGEWEGGTFRIRLAERDPLMLRAMREQRWDLLPGAESMDVFAQRLRLGLERILAATPDGAAAVAFLHGGVIGELCRQATGSEPFAFIHADNASVTRLVVRANGRRLLRSFNDTSHLAHVSRA